MSHTSQSWLGSTSRPSTPRVIVPGATGRRTTALAGLHASSLAVAQPPREWEQEMLARGFDCALISTQVDETAQHFWRKLGYADCGSFSVRGKPSELFMQRALK
jgi:hypothetical protein